MLGVWNYISKQISLYVVYLRNGFYFKQYWNCKTFIAFSSRHCLYSSLSFLYTCHINRCCSAYHNRYILTSLHNRHTQSVTLRYHRKTLVIVRTIMFLSKIVQYTTAFTTLYKTILSTSCAFCIFIHFKENLDVTPSPDFYLIFIPSLLISHLIFIGQSLVIHLCLLKSQMSASLMRLVSCFIRQCPLFPLRWRM